MELGRSRRQAFCRYLGLAGQCLAGLRMAISDCRNRHQSTAAAVEEALDEMGGCTAALLCIRRQEILDASRFKSRLVGRTRRVVQQIRLLVGSRVHVWCLFNCLTDCKGVASIRGVPSPVDH